LNIEIMKMAEEVFDYMVRVRRYLHQYPEISEQEFQTQRFILNELKNIGVDHYRIADTGVVGIIQGCNHDRVVAIRADMDALPIKEENKADYESAFHGTMHACGHDAHMSILLGTAKILKGLGSNLNGTVKLFFQPAEETVGGAKRMVEQGCMDNPKVHYTLGLHVMPSTYYDCVELKHGCLNASTDEIKVIFKGKSSHGAYPDKGTDAIVMASNFINSIQTIVSRNISPLNSSVLTFGTIRGGTKSNIIADKVELTGTLRTIDPETRGYMKKKIIYFANNISEVFEGSCEVNINEGYPFVINNKEVIDLIEKSVVENLPDFKISYRDQPSMGAEDFSYFTEQSKGAYYSVGCRIYGREEYPLHSSDFDIDERCMITGAATYISSILKILKEGNF